MLAPFNDAIFSARVSLGAVAVHCGVYRGSEQERLPTAAEATGLHAGTAGVCPRHEAAQQESPRGPALSQEETGLHIRPAV